MDLKITDNSLQNEVDSISISDQIFAVPFNEPLVHQVVVATLAGARAGTKAQKNRSMVRGGGRKPFRQKGMGRARAGTRSSPIWRGGGCTFAAEPRSFKQKINRKMRRGAMRSIFSELIRQKRLIVVPHFDSISEPRTKQVVALLKSLDLKHALFIDRQAGDAMYLAARNLPYVQLLSVSQLSVVSLVRFDNIVISVEALRQLEEIL